ncbi:enoyl-CoA hydratase [Desertibacillus haloalkaliphilus]|uniref:enoyl-CoA hydratase n=1 Tax=Desertibacillus haloalkaliphilus TaxID=1328930 RepID=UPI001C26110E|nr:enoyl-CoA hydratase [Desertibacillus haloalkaliphilus]MBU8905109.1 enoyl-CoA hydratase [Desertibacillus haloalkaliphilus]
MENLLLKKENHIAIVTLNRPPANALSGAVLNDLSAALDEVEQDTDIKVVVLNGEGRFFAAGADIKEFTTVKSGAEFTELAKKGQQLFDRIEQFSKPVIAAIHGAALGGGLELAMACHIRLATEDVKLGLPELQLGLIPGFAGSQRLPRLVGTAKAAEMILTSEPITGKEALSLGLINCIHSEQALNEEALKLAEKIAQKSAVSIKFALELLTYAKDQNFEKGVAKEAELFGEAFESEDGQEGIYAFIEKRKPAFKNK